MITFAIIATSLAIASIYFPRTSIWYLQLLERTAACALYFVFAVKCRHTEPESAFKVQRFILICSALVITYITFEPVFSRRHVSADFHDYSAFIFALIVGTLLVRWRYTDQD